jgi:hypothetical protein
MERETIPCRLCATPTPMLGTELCDRCWELENAIKLSPGLARQILNSLGGHAPTLSRRFVAFKSLKRLCKFRRWIMNRCVDTGNPKKTCKANYCYVWKRFKKEPSGSPGLCPLCRSRLPHHAVTCVNYKPQS